MPCNVDVIQRCNKNTCDVQLLPELSSFAIQTCPHCSSPLPFDEQIPLEFSNQQQSSPNSHSISFSRKKFLHCADAYIALGEHFCEMKSLFLLEIIPCLTCLFWA